MSSSHMTNSARGTLEKTANVAARRAITTRIGVHRVQTDCGRRRATGRWAVGSTIVSGDVMWQIRAWRVWRQGNNMWGAENRLQPKWDWRKLKLTGALFDLQNR